MHQDKASNAASRAGLQTSSVVPAGKTYTGVLWIGEIFVRPAAKCPVSIKDYVFYESLSVNMLCRPALNLERPSNHLVKTAFQDDWMHPLRQLKQGAACSQISEKWFRRMQIDNFCANALTAVLLLPWRFNMIVNDYWESIFLSSRTCSLYWSYSLVSSWLFIW